MGDPRNLLTVPLPQIISTSTAGRASGSATDSRRSCPTTLSASPPLARHQRRPDQGPGSGPAPLRLRKHRTRRHRQRTPTLRHVARMLVAAADTSDPPGMAESTAVHTCIRGRLPVLRCGLGAQAIRPLARNRSSCARGRTAPEGARQRAPDRELAGDGALTCGGGVGWSLECGRRGRHAPGARRSLAGALLRHERPSCKMAHDQRPEPLPATTYSHAAASDARNHLRIHEFGVTGRVTVPRGGSSRHGDSTPASSLWGRG